MAKTDRELFRLELTEIKTKLAKDGVSQTLDIGDGWIHLVVNLHIELKRLDPDYVLAQVKEKFGGLRYYAFCTSLDDQIRSKFRSLIHDAEGLSYTICEETGKPGILMRKKDGYWIRTLNPEWGEENGYEPA